ncbi:LamG-like jellyroll fold domain-containing protein [Jonesiaceae bacterium BS-20]|uniref:LamG-like jellyroll fold domain-containing protein n=1 Tax=Jonesiaceae bacterium BS-20 TaxID=3120821 RepID=A0AAU7DWK9_9MICO
MKISKTRLGLRGTLALATTAALFAAPLGAAHAAPADLPTPAAHYNFDQAPADGTTISDAVGNFDATLKQSGAKFENGSLFLPGGGANSNAAFVELPADLFTGQKTVTVSTWLQNQTGNGNYAATYVGADRTQGSSYPQNGYWLFNPANPEGWVKSVITSATVASPNGSPWSTEAGSGANGARATTDFALYTTVIDSANNTFSVYFNGTEIKSGASNTNLTDFGELVAFIGKSSYPDAYFKGNVDDYAVYHSALSATQIKDVYTAQAVERAELTVAQSIPAQATADFALPTSATGLTVQWAVTSGSAITVDAGTATVNRPAAGSNDDTVVLQAQYLLGGSVVSTTDHTVVVPAELTDQSKAQADLEAMVIENTEDMRMNFSVPTIGEHGSTFGWEIVTGQDTIAIVDGVNDATKTINIKRPAAGSAAVTVSLKVTVTNGSATVSETFLVKIQPMPSDQGELEAYFWAFFTGEGDGAEHVSVAASKGNDALAWNTLNNGVPIIESTEGTEGLRDPFIIRSKDGDKFYMIATDLRIAGLPGGFKTAQISGSKYLEIWESTDLINWSDQRHVKVSSDFAGNTWAPEAFYDDETEQYVVYWASNLYDTENAADRTDVTYNRMMYATTQDFISFSEPQVWIDVDQGKTAGVIDVSVAKEGDTYYRFYKNEKNMTLLEEKSNVFLDTYAGTTMPGTHNDPNKWSLITKEIASGLPNGAGNNKFHQGEGPTVFKSNDGDINGNEWYLMIDQPGYHGGPNHYVPFATKKSLADTAKEDWHSEAAKLSQNLPQNADGGKPRHGTIIPVTRSEYQAILEAYQPNIAVKSVAALSVETVEGTAPVLPTNVDLTMFDGADKSAAVIWDEVDAADFAQPGQFTVRGVAQDDSRMPVEVTVTVTEEVPPVVEVDKSVLTAAATAAGELDAADYTADSWADVVAALADAEDVLADVDATQDEVDGAVAALAAAVENLVKVPGPIDPTDPTDPPAPGDGDKPGAGDKNDSDQDDTDKDATDKPADPSDDDLASTGANVMGVLLALLVMGLGGFGLLAAARKRA